jgi:hypothetical protein
MEATIVVDINPIRRFLGFVPEIFNVYLNNDSSSLVFVIAAARKKPPNISQITLLEKGCDIPFNVFRCGVETFHCQA